MNLAIIENTKSDADALVHLLREFFNKYNILPQIETYSSSEAFLSVFEPDKYDVCFFDIFLEDLNGMEAAGIVHDKDPDCFIIFTSNSRDFLQEGYRVRALRYFIKPVSLADLEDVLPDLIERHARIHKRLTIRMNAKEYSIPFSNIFYIASSARTEIHLKDTVYTVSSKESFSKTVEPLLDDYRFITCSRGVVINMSHLKEITRTRFLMENGDYIPISRRLFTSVRDQFMNFQFEHLL